MWNAQEKMEISQHQLGKVIGQSGEVILVQGSNHYQSLPIAAPYGITWLPPKNTMAVVLSSNIGEGINDICVGTSVKNIRIAPGELLLQSLGGAEIYLKNTGEVIINGQTFVKQEE